MKDRFHPMVFAAIFAFAAPLALGIIANWRDLVHVHHWPGAATWAAWLQAIGSVSAIIAAIWISNEQGRQAILKEERARIAELEALSEAVSSAAGAIQKCYRDEVLSREMNRPQYQASRILLDVAEGLASFSIARLPGGTGIVPNLFAMRRTILEAIAAIEDFTGSYNRAEKLRRLGDDAAHIAAGFTMAVVAAKEWSDGHG